MPLLSKWLLMMARICRNIWQLPCSIGFPGFNHEVSSLWRISNRFIQEADKFRTQFLPLIMADLHFCGDPKWPDEPCFPTLQPWLALIHCEIHICIFERNDEPEMELDVVQSNMPRSALDLKKCKSMMR